MTKTPRRWQGLDPDAKRELLTRLLREKAAQEAVQPLSHGQRALWLLHQMAPESAAYNVAFAARIRSALDVAALTRAFSGLTERHEMLRTTYGTRGGEHVQRIYPKLDLAIEEEDASGWTPEELKRRLAASYARPFDLERGPVIRANLFHQSAVEHVLLVTVHHISYDGWSFGLLVGDLMALYAAEREGRVAPLEPLPARYADFVRWQDELLAGAAGEEMWAYWQRQLRGPLPTIQLPSDKPRPSAQSFRGGTHPFRIEEPLATRLRELARQQGATLYMVLFAAFAALLHRYSGQEDILVGSATAGRSRREFERLMGYFVNPIVLRADLSGNPTFTEHVARVRAVVVDALNHADFPFPLLVQRLNPRRDPSRSPLFQVVFNLIKLGQSGVTGAPASEGAVLRPSLGDLDLEFFAIPQQEGLFDLDVEVLDTGGVLIANIKYATDLFEPATIARMASHWRLLLEGMVAHPHARLKDLPLLTEAERHEVLEVWNRTGMAYPAARCAHELVEEQARVRPEALAAEGGGRKMSYRELNERAERLAERLRGHGVRSGSLVAIYLERSIEMVVALLGVWKAGGAYVPIDPEYPAERVRFMLEDTQALVVLTQKSLSKAVPAAAAVILDLDAEEERVAGSPRRRAKRSAMSAEQLAYVIYTSGSTGRPKGVPITHGSLFNLICWHQQAYEVTPADRATQIAGPAFDASVWEIWPYLTAGASVHIPDEATRLDLGRLVRWLIEQRITLTFLPTPLAEAALRESWPEDGALRVLLTGGDRLNQRPAQKLPFRLINHYGPTENTVVSTCAEVRANDTSHAAPPIGRPLPNTRAYVLDAQLQPMPIGVPGELLVGGVQLAAGYLNRAELSAEKFIPDPFSATPGARLYKTGDLVRYLPDGNIEFLGRIDHQVKIRGYRIELGEIEAVLGRLPQVLEAVAVVREDQPGDKRVVAYVVPHDGQAFALGELRSVLKQHLPDYMVPSAFVTLDKLPLTPNGKVDRKALPTPERSALEHVAYIAPRTPTEEIVAGIWAEVLGLERVGIEDDFFELGGHSLLATQVVSRARKALGVELPLRDLFNAPTVAGLAARIEAQRAAAHVLPAAPPLLAEPWEGPAELSYAQQRLWFLDQLEPGSSAYVIAGALEIEGPLDVGALERALSETVTRHEALRTTFASVDGRPVQLVSPPGPLPLPLVDLSSEAEPRERVSVLIREEAQRGFDLSRGPLFRPVLYRLAAETHVLLLSMHHIVSDGWSIGVMFRELGALYDAGALDGASSLQALPLQYRDFARWQRGWLQEEVLEGQLSHWRARLTGAPQALELPTDHPRPAVESHRGTSYSFTLPRELSDALRALSRREGVTLFTTLLAGFALLLSRYTGREDLLVGSPVANRNRAEIEGLVGCFVNTLVLRANLAGDPTLRDLLARVQEECLQAFSHQDLPFEKLVEELLPERDPSRNPLFQVMLVLHNAPLEPLRLGELSLRPVDVDRRAAQLDLTFHVQETPEGLRGTFEYATDLFESATIARMGGHLEVLLRAIVERPETSVSELPLLTEAERVQAVSGWNAGVSYPKGLSLHERFEQQVARTPDAVAAVCEEQRLTYGELNRRANQLAHRLRELGVGPDQLVGLRSERNLEMVIGILGILKAGGAYLPLDPAYPRDRVEFMLQDSRTTVVVTQKSLAADLDGLDATRVLLDEPFSGPDTNPAPAVAPDDLAYVIYTSGSTGTPKGVQITHYNVTRLFDATDDWYHFGRDDVWSLFHSYAFDFSVWELWGALLYGGCVVVVPYWVSRSPDAFRELLVREGVTVLNQTPAAFRQLIQADLAQPKASLALRYVIFGGEALELHSLRPWFERYGDEKPLLVNMYGITETTIHVTYRPIRLADLEAGAGSVIGVPIPDLQLYLLDAHGQLVPIGVAGEMYVGGAGVARGYLNRPELNVQRFVADPFSGREGVCLYRSGDLARRLPNGDLEYLGRIDQQVKIRGFRIELGEIEAAIAQHPSVREVVVIAREDVSGDKRLVAYLVVEGQAAAVVEALRRLLRDKLPEYMVPAHFVALDALPLTPNGKVDRKQLPAPERSDQDAAFVPPRTPTEEIVAGIWAEVLGLERVGIEDDFFELGGHSLLATQAMSRLRATFGVELPLRSLFEAPTVDGLAEIIEALVWAAQDMQPASSVTVGDREEIEL